MTSLGAWFFALNYSVPPRIGKDKVEASSELRPNLDGKYELSDTSCQVPVMFFNPWERAALHMTSVT